MGEFGKNERRLDDIPVHHGNVQQQAALSRKAGRQDNAPKRKEYWSEQFKLPIGADNAATIKVVPGEYETIECTDKGELYRVRSIWKKAYEHATRSGTGICSGGPYRFMESFSDQRDPCHGCDISWEDRWERRAKGENEWENRKVRTSALYGFSVAVLGTVHLVPSIYGPKSKHAGQVKVDSKGNKVMEWVCCSRRGCEGCRTGAESQDGILLPWVMRTSHFRTLTGWSASIGQDCLMCGGERTISIDTWNCPTCQEVVVDERTTNRSREDLDAFVMDTVICPKCRNEVMLQEVISCTGCDSPLRANLWDVEIDVYAEKDANGHLNLQKARVSRPKGVEERYAHLVIEPLDMDALLRPTSLETQAKRFGIEDKLTADKVERMARDYTRA